MSNTWIKHLLELFVINNIHYWDIHETCNIVLIGGGVDFVSDEVVATFNPGDTIATVNIPIIDDGIVEPIEFFGLILRVEENTDEDGRLFVTLGPNRIVAASIRDSGMCK